MFYKDHSRRMKLGYSTHNVMTTKKQILVTGATGNVGKEVIHFLFGLNSGCEIIAGVRNIEKAKYDLALYPRLKYKKFDLDDTYTYQPALTGINSLFLLRPPQISDVEKIFRPLIQQAKECKVTEIVFLSVQGADKTSYIPHAKIERLIKETGINYIFVRPSYFMQNLTTTLADDLRENTIKLPAGKALFNWIDVANIGQVVAQLLTNFEQYHNLGLDITGKENLNFEEVVDRINAILNTQLKYRSVNLFSFYRHKRKQRVSMPMIFVMIMLHFFPRFQKSPHISDNFKNITGKEPTLLNEYIRKDKTLVGLLK